jgi:Arabinose-binding domain of AraC transcription regulator, N-term
MLKHFRVPGRLAVKMQELGVSVPTVLRKAGLPRDIFEQTRVLVSTGELFALWRAIGQVSADPLIGAKLGMETKTERFHPMAIAALSTENLVAASQHMARYKKLTAPEEILVELDGEEFTVGFRWLLAVDEEPGTLTDYCFSWMRSLARHGSGTALTLSELSTYSSVQTSSRSSVIWAAKCSPVHHATWLFSALAMQRSHLSHGMLNCSICLRRNSRSSCDSTKKKIPSWSWSAAPFRTSSQGIAPRSMRSRRLFTWDRVPCSAVCGIQDRAFSAFWTKHVIKWPGTTLATQRWN